MKLPLMLMWKREVICLNKVVKLLKQKCCKFIARFEKLLLRLCWILNWKKKFESDFAFLTDHQYTIQDFNKSLFDWSIDFKESEMQSFNLDFIPYEKIIGLFIDKYNNISDKQKMFITRWMYNGFIYRVLDTDCVNYNNKISSWTKNYFVLSSWFKKDYDNKKMTIIVAHTGSNYGFDFGNYNKYYAKVSDRPAVLYEEEIIFRENKDYVIEEFYGTWNEFKAHVKQLNLIDKKD